MKNLPIILKSHQSNENINNYLKCKILTILKMYYLHKMNVNNNEIIVYFIYENVIQLTMWNLSWLGKKSFL